MLWGVWVWLRMRWSLYDELENELFQVRLLRKDTRFLPDSLRPAEATDMRLVVVDFPTAEADIVLLYWNRQTLTVRRMYGSRSRVQLVG